MGEQWALLLLLLLNQYNKKDFSQILVQFTFLMQIVIDASLR